MVNMSRAWSAQRPNDDEMTRRGGAMPTVGSGQVATETREVSGFTRIRFESVGVLNITQTGEESLTVSADDNVLPYITTRVHGGTLDIGMEGHVTINPKSKIIFTLTVKSLEEIDLSGAASIHATDINTDTLDVRFSGAGKMELTGSARTQTVMVSGAGGYEAKDFKTRETRVKITGAGYAHVYADETLDATVTGVGKVTYYGSAEVRPRVTGIGSIKPGR